jgi:hypothetical protein
MLTNEQYHKSHHLSATKLRVFLQSPLAYRHEYIDGHRRPETDAMAFGTLIHAMALEPETVADRFIAWSGQSRATKAGKEEYAEAQTSGKMIVSKADFDEAQTIANICREQLPWGDTERTFRANILGVDCQCRADLYSANGEVWDIKTAARLDKWIADFKRGELLFSDAFYRMVIKAETGVLPPPVRYLGISTTAPYDHVIYHYPEYQTILAMRIVEGHIARFGQCLKTNVWPGLGGLDNPVQECELEAWASAKIESQAFNDESLNPVFYGESDEN